MRFAPYYPTHEHVVELMLRFGELAPGERMFDLGSGDGRIVIRAAQQFEADATGVELDPDLVRQSRARIAELGLERRARIIEGDLIAQNYSAADLVTAYLIPGAMEEVAAILRAQLRPGARVIVNSFDFGEHWSPSEEMAIPDANTGVRMLYLYRR